MAVNNSSVLYEETRAIVEHLEESLVAARKINHAVIESSRRAIDENRELLSSLLMIRECMHDAEVHIAKLGEFVTNDVVLSEVHERTKRGAA
jgi:hypothetical protein